jgi:hypothetical protein
MLHLIWYIIVGLIAGFVAKSIMHTHMSLFWERLSGPTRIQQWTETMSAEFVGKKARRFS